MKRIGSLEVLVGSFGMEKRDANSFSRWMRVQDQFAAVLGFVSHSIEKEEVRRPTPDSIVVHGGSSRSCGR